MKQIPPSTTYSWRCAVVGTVCLGSLPLLLASTVWAQTPDAGEAQGAPAAAATLTKVTLDSDPTLWQSGELRLNDELFDLSRPEVVRNSPFEDMVRRDLLRLMIDYGNGGVTLSKALKNQTSQTKRWVGYAYAAAGDERAVSYLEDVLGQTPKPVLTKAKAVDLTYLLICLSSYYEKKGELVKAAETQLRVFDYVQEGKLPKDPVGAKVPVAGMLANQLITAARLYKRAGEGEKAKALYAQVQDFDYGWATGLAQIDDARDLISQGKYDQAVQILQTPSPGKYSDQIELVKLFLLGRAYFLNGNLSSAKQFMQKSIDRYSKVEELLPGEGIEEIIGSAKRDLALIDGWIQHPIQSDVKEINITVDKAAEKSIIRRVQLHTFKDVKLKATTNNKFVEARITSLDVWDDKNSRMEVIIELKPEALHQQTTTVVTIEAMQDGDHKLEIQIQVM